MANSIFLYEPFHDFGRFFDEAFNIFNQQLGGQNNFQLHRYITSGNQDGTMSLFQPRMDLHEDKGKNLVTASFELPGLKKEDVKIELQNNRLTISGESNTPSEVDRNGFVIRERRVGKFTRILQLPEGIKSKEIKASMENGILTVSFPRTSPELAPTIIPLL